MSLYSAIDLHSNNLVLVVSDEEDHVVFERRLGLDLKSVLESLSPYREELASVAVESTYNWYWLVDGLQESGHTAKLVNTWKAQQFAGLKYTDDRHDARWLAKLSRLGILPEGWICPREHRGSRDLLRCRSQLVQLRTSLLLAMKCVLARELGESVSVTSLKSGSVGDQIEGIEDPSVRHQITSRALIVEPLTEQILDLERIVEAQGRERPEYRWLRSMPGVGKVLSLTIQYETGDIDRFPSVGEYASYCRCVRSHRLSNGKRKGTGNRKNGNRFLSWAFSEVAHLARRYDPRAQRFHERKLKQGGHRMVADRALAHKFARAAYWVMRNRVPYDAKRLFG